MGETNRLHPCRRGVAWLCPAVLLVSGLVAGCGGPVPWEGPVGGAVPPPTKPVTPEPEDPFDPGTVVCDEPSSLASDSPALLVRDPTVLEGFTLERVLAQLIDRSGIGGVTPEELLKRLFDTQNSEEAAVYPDNVHCDSQGNLAFKNGPPADCPRAEGTLALSDGLFTPDHPDYFAPIALVNRFDLTPVDAPTCGEYRIVYAKWSGREDPNDRVFLIFEGALANPTFSLDGCRPVVEHWAGLEEVKGDPGELAARLEAFYFEGIEGFPPLVDPLHFGLKAPEESGYGGSSGQVRVSQRMQDPWEMREFRMTPFGGGGPAVAFVPTTVKNNPIASLFNLSDMSQTAQSFRLSLVSSEVKELVAPSVARIRMRIPNMYNAGESAVGGAAEVNYASQALADGDTLFTDAIMAEVNNLNANDACPPEDPLTAESVLHRATALTCAGCHAPQKFIGEERKIGCGLTWPSTLGEVHITEDGELSEALTDVFLPRRAEIMALFLEACDWDAIRDSLQPPVGNTLPK
jgi:hypothetical protein